MIARLTNAGMDRRLAEVLLDVVGNCAADLVQRGTGTFESDWRINPPTVGWPILTLAASGADSEAEECENCTPDTSQSQLLLTLAGDIPNVEGECDSCADILGEYVLTQDPDNPCIYNYSGSETCGTLALQVQLNSTGIAGSILLGGIPHAQISFSLTAPYDCSAARTVSPLSNISAAKCDFTEVTASIRAARQIPTVGGLTKDNVGNFYAQFRALNWEGSYDCETKRVIGGFGAIFKGPVYMDQIIGPDGSCINPSTVAGTIDNFVNVRRSGGSRIIENEDGDYVLQDHMFTDTVVAEVTDHGWETRYTFPRIDALVEEITWDLNGNRKIQQTRKSDISVIAGGSSTTSDVIAATRVSQFLKHINYYTDTHQLTQAYATEIYVFDVGPSNVSIVDQAEPCSGAGVEEMHISTADLSVRAATLSASATYTERLYSATMAKSVGAATLAASALHAHKRYSATAALTAGAATFSASATHA